MSNRKKTLLPILLAVLTLGMVSTYSAERSSAYFTTYAIARGGVLLDLGPTRNKINDEYTAGRKSVSILNQGEHDCYARVKVLAPEWLMPADPNQPQYLRIYGDGWRDGGDGFWYCDTVLKPGDTTPVLTVETSWLKMTEELQKLMETCDVVIVDEFTMVRYREDGTPWADWKWQEGSDVK